MIDNQELNNRLVRMEQAIKGLEFAISKLAQDMSKYATQGQLKTSESNTKNIINRNSQAITSLQEKLNTISLPDNTKYYLRGSEIEDFRNNYRSLIAMMADAERLYQSLISYVANLG